MLYGRLPTTRSCGPSVAKSKSSASATCSVKRLRREIGGEARGEVAVDLDRVMCPARSISRAGQRGEARADLDEVVARPRRDRGDDALDVVRVGEEVLAEALARDWWP